MSRFLSRRLRIKARRVLGAASHISVAVKRVVLYEEYSMLRYTIDEIANLHSLIRYVLPESPSYQAHIEQTRASFDYQWKHVFGAAFPAATDDFRTDALSLLQRYTGFPLEWFRGKRALDAGCGNGRWSWALSKAGAAVTAIDQSDAGVRATLSTCDEFPNVRALQHDLLRPLHLPQEFDLVWSFGVLHHTGNTRTALGNIAACVKPNGYLYLMLYGEPRWRHPEDFREINRYNEMRQTLAPMSFQEKAAFLQSKLAAWDARNWFDAASPAINDLHRQSEIAEWLRQLDFTDLRFTSPGRNIHVVARRSA